MTTDAAVGSFIMGEGKQDKPGGRRSGRRWYVLDVLLGVVILAGSSYFVPAVGYVAGLRNDKGLAFTLVMFVVFVLWPASAGCLVVVVFRMVRTWPKHIAKRGTLWLLRLGALGGFAALLVVPFTPLRLPGPPGYAHGFRRYVLGKVDIVEVQTWLSALGADVYTHGPVRVQRAEEGPVWPDTTNWPPSLTRLDPVQAYFRMTVDRRLTIRLTWVVPGESWGVEIGPVDMPIPKSRPRTRDNSHKQVVWNDGEYRLRMAPGAYVWQEIR